MGVQPGALRPAYDFIVVGGGSAGAAVARRLAERSEASVLVIEAGPTDAGVAAIADGGQWVKLLYGPYDWGYAYQPTPLVNHRTIPIPRGKVLGGSSSINAMLWYRGYAEDYDAWAAAGAAGWDFASVLPYFKRIEDWEGGETALRGVGGPIHIKQPEDPHPIARAMLGAAEERGWGVVDDLNGPVHEGAALANLTMLGATRWNTARGYLRPAMDRPNLTVLTNSPALRLEFEGTRCVAVVHLVDGQPRRTRALAEVVLTLGAIDTPRLMMLSGLGDAMDLARLGLPVVADLPGVGCNLQDHPLLMGVNFRSRRPLGAVRDNGGGSMMNWRSRPDLPRADLTAFIVQGPHAGPEITAAHDLSGDVFAISPGLMRSKSVGFLRLDSADPGRAPVIQPNYLAEPEDLAALVAAVDQVMELAESVAYRDWVAGPAAPARRLDKAGRTEYVRNSCSTFFHTCGTAAMGTGPMAVVDPATLSVRGVAGLRVADASVMPIIPSCHTLAPTLMIAERAADMIAPV